MPRGQRAGKARAATAGTTGQTKGKSSPPQIVGKSKLRLGTSVEEGRVWRQKDHIERSLNELKGRDGAPFQLHISDNDALDFDTYSKSLFEDPLNFKNRPCHKPCPARAFLQHW